ncbi:S-formylglutathione hydrolase [Vulgatibacter incomptus]|uniref:S-formylglutathione hydrolase n=1 Tax=Vulgatibacter incomptus TaxID=1391653 RepID=A0A0K1PH58_9BACT|nr:S-formylglutathione hydrolase [Vulgatibacter incomptus]AKU92855.1 S-formylglutathione hydrolase [Vulgatibacter incomptus]
MSERPTLVSSSKTFGGSQLRLRHRSQVLHCEMTYSVFLPPQSLAGARVPALYWLSGLSSTDENFMQKAGAQRVAAELGIAIVASDTSPRGDGVPSDPGGGWDLGLGAGFYVNATREPWARNYRMYDYVVDELPALVEEEHSLSDSRGISGHSMGGHGALVCALRNPGRYRSLSAFSPISNPMRCPWGEKAFSHYLGSDRKDWHEWDASELLSGASERLPILVDQGGADPFLETQLHPEALRAAAERAGHPLTLRMQPGYDHSYFFIATFIEDHLRHHAKALVR